ncbi:MAG: sulfopyruvate decarboxylase subunit alpha, partial [Candidatus Hermodarchaeota archaeon]
MNIDLKLYESIKESGINLLLTLPDNMIKGLLKIIEEKKEIIQISITREEEGIGIAAGAYLGGLNPALLIQNSGLGNSINAIKSLLQLYKIPVLLIMSHRGMEKEKIVAQVPMGQVTSKLLDCINLKTFIVKNAETVENIKKAMKYI